MAVKYEGDLSKLVHDLEIRGFRVRKSQTIAGAPGRTADIFLENDVIVRWDAYSVAVWAEGPARQSRRVETYLRRLYEGGIWAPLTTFGLWRIRTLVRFVMSKRSKAKTLPPAALPATAGR